MTTMTNDRVLAEAFGANEGAALWIKRAILVLAGIAVLALTAKVKLFAGSPVPITLTSFAVLTIGAGYGARLGLVTILGYLLVGLAGYDVFAGSSAENYGWVYMTGGTGGYLVGYALAALVLGFAARRGLDRNFFGMGLAMFVGTLAIYVPGLLWLSGFAESWAQTFAWGLTPFIYGDLVKLALAAMVVPALWKLIGSARG